MSIALKNVAAEAQAYDAYRTEGNRTSYIGVSHTDSVKDLLTVTSNAPKRSSASYGNRRSSFNLIRSVSVPNPAGGSDIKDAKIELVVSLPVGTLAAEVQELFTRLSTLDIADFESAAVLGRTQL